MRAAKSDSSGEQIARLGMVSYELTEEQKKQLQIEGGLLVEEVRGANVRA